MHRHAIVKRFVIGSLALAAILSVSQTQTASADAKLELQLSRAVSMAPAYVVVRAIVEHNADNRELEIVADSPSFYRRTVLDLDGEMAPKVNELKLVDIPGGEYEITATLYDAHGQRTTARRSLMVMSMGDR